MLSNHSLLHHFISTWTLCVQDLPNLQLPAASHHQTPFYCSFAVLWTVSVCLAVPSFVFFFTLPLSTFPSMAPFFSLMWHAGLQRCFCNYLTEQRGYARASPTITLSQGHVWNLFQGYFFFTCINAQIFFNYVYISWSYLSLCHCIELSSFSSFFFCVPLTVNLATSPSLAFRTEC